jgi:hypothetical protein
VPGNAGGGDVMEMRSGDAMETRGGSRRVEKMENETMNCLAQGNN